MPPLTLTNVPFDPVSIPSLTLTNALFIGFLNALIEPPLFNTPIDPDQRPLTLTLTLPLTLTNASIDPFQYPHWPWPTPPLWPLFNTPIHRLHCPSSPHWPFSIPLTLTDARWPCPIHPFQCHHWTLLHAPNALIDPTQYPRRIFSIGFLTPPLKMSAPRLKFYPQTQLDTPPIRLDTPLTQLDTPQSNWICPKSDWIRHKSDWIRRKSDWIQP